MKSKIKLFIISIILFTFIFYRQNLGLNLGLYGLFLSLSVFYFIPKDSRNTTFYILIVGSVLSSLSFAWYGDFASFFALLSSLSLLAMFAFSPQLKWVTSFLLVPIHFIIAVPLFLFNFSLPTEIAKKDITVKIIYYFVVPLFLVISFLTVYSFASTNLADFFSNFTLNFNVEQTLILLILGSLLGYLFYFFRIPKEFLTYFLNLPENFSGKDASAVQTPFNSIQIKGGEITLVLLNTILLIFLGIYVYETWFETYSENRLSQELHESIYAVIFSIVMAIGVIFYYFRSEKSFINTKKLRNLAFIWIGLNGLLVLTAVLKNTEYIQYYGLTEKRLGVYAFLILCVLGLSLTWEKLKLIKTNWFIIHPMVRAIYALILVIAIFNWSWIITAYNLATDHKDLNYLQSLEYNKLTLYREFGTVPTSVRYSDKNIDTAPLSWDTNLYDWYVENEIKQDWNNHE